VTSKIFSYKILYKLAAFSIIVRHFEFYNSDFKFIISDLQNLYILNLLLFLIFVRHFEFCNLDFRFITSNLENPYIPNFMKISRVDILNFI